VCVQALNFNAHTTRQSQPQLYRERLAVSRSMRKTRVRPLFSKTTITDKTETSSETNSYEQWRITSKQIRSALTADLNPRPQTTSIATRRSTWQQLHCRQAKCIGASCAFAVRIHCTGSLSPIIGTTDVVRCDEHSAPGPSASHA
jgi:hypothetical protein